MKCQKCGTEFNGNFCPACGTRSLPVVSVAATQTVQPEAKEPRNFLQLLIVMLLACNLLATVAFGIAGMISGASESERTTMEDMLAEGQNIELSNVEYVSSSYGSGELVGTVKNTASYELQDIGIEYDFYYNGQFAGSGSAYVDRLPAGAEIAFDLYCPDADFDEYQLYQITAYKK